MNERIIGKYTIVLWKVRPFTYLATLDHHNGNETNFEQAELDFKSLVRFAKRMNKTVKEHHE